MDGLASITSVGSVLVISSNPQMCQESVDALITRLNALMEPDPTIFDATNNSGVCP